jgi:hypothetical protein
MPALSKASLKTIWVNYFQPTSSNFSDLIDSWTDFSVGLQALGQAVSAGSTGVVNFASTSTVSFLAVGAEGQALLGTATEASARTELGLGTLATQSTVTAANLAAASVSAAAIVDNSITLAKVARVGTTGQSLISGGTAADAAYGWTGVVQRVSTRSGSVATNTTALPYDDTPPLNTEGAELMTATITPRSANNLLLVDVNVFCATSVGDMTIALFQDATVTAVAAGGTAAANRANAMMQVSFRYEATAATTSPLTFRVRGGVASGTFTFNGQSGGRLYGGAIVSSISVTEVAP